MNKTYRIWPHYFDCTVSRFSGRKIPKTLCIDRPSIDIILDVCKKLNLKCQYIKDKKHPKHWFKYTGLILIDYSGRKSELIKLIAKNIKEKHRHNP